MKVNPADVEVPEISTPDVDIGLDNAFLVVVFGCLKCDTSFALKVSTQLPNSDFYKFLQQAHYYYLEMINGIC